MNNEWIKWEWTAEKPYPETLETYVRTKRGDGLEDSEAYFTVGWWHGRGTKDSSNWRCSLEAGLITHYRLA